MPISANEISECVTRLYACITAVTNALSELTLPNVKFVLAARDVVRMEKWYKLHNMFLCRIPGQTR